MPTSREFILGLNAQAEFATYSNHLRLVPYMKDKAKHLAPDAYVDDEPKNHSNNNRYMPPHHFLRWGFERTSDHPNFWTHKFVRAAVNLQPQFVREYADSDGSINWAELAAQIAALQVNGSKDYFQWLCVTVTNGRGAQPVLDPESLTRTIDQSVLFPIQVSSETGPKSSFFDRLLRR